MWERPRSFIRVRETVRVVSGDTRRVSEDTCNLLHPSLVTLVPAIFKTRKCGSAEGRKSADQLRSKKAY